MKKFITASLAVAVLVVVTAVCLASSYVGNSRSYKFHYDDCRYVDMMSGYNKVYFNNREDAINEGYIPCKVCQP